MNLDELQSKAVDGLVELLCLESAVCLLSVYYYETEKHVLSDYEFDQLYARYKAIATESSPYPGLINYTEIVGMSPEVVKEAVLKKFPWLMKG